MKEFFVLKQRLFVKKRAIYVIYQISDSKLKERQKYGRLLKKGHQKFSALKLTFSPKKIIQKLFAPPNSAPSLRLCTVSKHKSHSLKHRMTGNACLDCACSERQFRNAQKPSTPKPYRITGSCDAKSSINLPSQRTYMYR